MKKLVTLLLAAGMVLGSFAGAQAIDWKVKGNWQFEFNYTDGVSFVSHQNRNNHRKRYGNGVGRDNFEALQRINLVLQAVASENLSGTLHLEIGHTVWGQANTLGTRSYGGSMGQRAVSIGVREAYIDWFVPTTDLKLRMGIQRLDTPSYTFGPMVFGQDVAGVTASYKVNDNIGVTAFWARPFNDNFGGVTAGENNFGAGYGGFGQSRSMDNVDVFGLLLPLSFDGFKVTPWGIIGAVGPNWARPGTAGAAYPSGSRFSAVGAGMTPSFYDTNNRRARTGSEQYATAWWAGLTGEITAMDPFRLAWDATYGEIQYADTGFLNRHGWIINLLAEYKLDWGIPGIYGWWGSGDDSNPRNGSERMPVFDITDPNNMMSTFGFNGSYSQGGSDGIDGIYAQSSFTGTWGIGARIRDISFLEDLKHTVRVNFFGGTNSPAMAKYMTGKKTVGGARTNDVYNAGGVRTTVGTADFYNAIGGLGPYMTTQDYGIEVNFDSLYKIYENLDMIVELGYIHLWMDQSRSVWGSSPTSAIGAGGTRGVSITDAVKASLMFRYSF